MADVRKARVLVVDVEPVSRCGLVHLLNSHERLCVVAEAEAIPPARELCERHKPDIVVFDSALGDGVAFIHEVKRFSPEGRVVVFTAQVDALSVARAYRAGAAGYVTRRDPVSALMTAVIGALEGDRQLAPCVQRVLMDQLICGGMEVRGGAESVLSDRELQIFRLRGQGLRTSAVAQELCISVKTVETHLQRIKTKLNLSSGAALQQRAILFQDSEKPIPTT
jgi:two-component system invasion response regulator UvrY